MREAALTSTFCRVNEALIACLPESFIRFRDAVALHFKGRKKEINAEYCNAFLNKKNQTDSYYPHSIDQIYEIRL